jgi:hypothetical protein
MYPERGTFGYKLSNFFWEIEDKKRSWSKPIFIYNGNTTGTI